MRVFMARRVLSSWIVLPITKLSKLDSGNDSGGPLKPPWNWRHRCRLQGLRTNMELGASFSRSSPSRLSTWWGKTKLSFSRSRISNASRDIGKVVDMTVNRLLVTDAQHQNAASRRLLRAGQRQRYNS